MILMRDLIFKHLRCRCKKDSSSEILLMGKDFFCVTRNKKPMVKIEYFPSDNKRLRMQSLKVLVAD